MRSSRLSPVTVPRTGFIARHSVAAFFILAMALGAGAVFLVANGLLPAGLALASALSASIAGIVMTAVEDGRDGLKLMLRRLLIWRVGIGYWLFSLLFLVPVVLLSAPLNGLFGGDSPSYDGLSLSLDFLPLFIGFFIVAGLGQELGWTGFLIPRLQARFSALTSCVFRAILAGIWHLPLLVYAGSQHPAFSDFPYGGWIAAEGYLVTIGALLLMFLLPWSILFTWIFNNTGGSLLLVAVLHGSEIWVAYWMLRTGISPSNLDNYWAYGALLVLIAAVIVLATGPKHLSRKQARITH
jgi:membrane protease YdiL (CAAX protease family)